MSASEVHEILYIKRAEQIYKQNELNRINKEIEDLKAQANEFERKAQKANKTPKPTSQKGPKAKKTGSPRKQPYTNGNPVLVERAKAQKKAALAAIEEARSSIKY